MQKLGKAIQCNVQKSYLIITILSNCLNEQKDQYEMT